MPDKTKATMQGRQCHLSSVHSSVQDITLINVVKDRATVSGFVLFRSFSTSPQFEVFNEIITLQLTVQSLTQIRGDFQSPRKAAGIELQICNSDNCLICRQSVKMRFGYAALQYTPEKSGGHINIGEIPVQCLEKKRYIQKETTIITIKTACHGLSIFPTPMKCGYQPARLGSIEWSLVFLRWRRLISPLAAITKKPAVLSPSSLRRSISSSTSWGMRTVVICDFAFFVPVAITEAPLVRCISVYAKKMTRKDLRCISLWASFKKEGDIHLLSAKPGSGGTLTGPLTKPLIEVTVMAGNQHTQTHPKFTWRFLAIDRADMAAKPCLLSVVAETEKDARRVLAPHFILSLAARLPVVEVHHA